MQINLENIVIEQLIFNFKAKFVFIRYTYK